MIIWRENKKANKQKREALVNTNQCEEPEIYSSSAVIVRVLRDKMASEMSAANEYSQMIESLSGSGSARTVSGNANKSLISIINRLSEIRNDEENHAGVLLQCIQLLDPEVMKNGTKGFYGKE
jgi:4-diphosphocytidyl-2C-methyl-D-erythritol kinase